MIKVRFIPDKHLERAANNLLEKAFQTDLSGVTLPIDVEWLAQNYLGYSIEFDDLFKKAGENTWGAISFENKLISVDERLDTTDKDYAEFEARGANGRFRYTISHEICHDVAHKPYWDILKEIAQVDEHSFLCRDFSKKPNYEYQADRFASCLLMPDELMIREFERIQSGLDMDRIKYIIRSSSTDLLEIDLAWYLSDYKDQLADCFGVSQTALEIKMKKLNLFFVDSALRRNAA